MELLYNKKVIIGLFISCVLTSAIEMNHTDVSSSRFQDFGEMEKKPNHSGPMSRAVAVAQSVTQAPIQRDDLFPMSIIVVPSNCPKNYKADSNGNCRPIV
jgi:hypothetical protein